VGCASSTGAVPGRFLSDYSQLRPGHADQARLLYINENADFSRYQQAVVDPVVVWDSAGAGFSGVTREELENLAAHFSTVLREQLGHEFELAEQAAPGTLQIRVAIVEGRRPSGSGAATVGGRIGIEVEILDASTAEQLIAAADTRVGLGVEPGSSRDGSAARKAFDDWALRMATKLAVLRQFDTPSSSPAQ